MTVLGLAALKLSSQLLQKTDGLSTVILNFAGTTTFKLDGFSTVIPAKAGIQRLSTYFGKRQISLHQSPAQHPPCHHPQIDAHAISYVAPLRD
jgi:hypothetical protein